MGGNLDRRPQTLWGIKEVGAAVARASAFLIRL